MTDAIARPLRSTTCAGGPAPSGRASTDASRRGSPTWTSRSRRPIRDALVDAASTDVGYPRWPGDRPVAAARAVRRADGDAVRLGSPTSDRLHELTDVMQGVVAAIHHLTRPGDGVVLHMPAYPPFLAAIDGARPAAGRGAGASSSTAAGRSTTTRSTRDSPPSRRGCCCCATRTTRPGTCSRRTSWSASPRSPLATTSSSISDEVHAELVHPPHGHVPFAVARARRRSTHGHASRRRRRRSTWPGCAGRSSTPAATELAGRARRPAAALPRCAEPDGGRGDATRRGPPATRGSEPCRPARRQPSPARRRCCRRTCPTSATVVPEATYLAWLDCRALGPRRRPGARRSASVASSSAPARASGRSGIGFARLNFATGPAVLTRIVEAMAGADG